MAQVAEAFHVLPTEASRALDDDAGLNLECLGLLRYAEMYYVFQRGKKDEIKQYADSLVMQRVIRNDHALAEEELARDLAGEGT